MRTALAQDAVIALEERLYASLADMRPTRDRREGPGNGIFTVTDDATGAWFKVELTILNEPKKHGHFPRTMAEAARELVEG